MKKWGILLFALMGLLMSGCGSATGDYVYEYDASSSAAVAKEACKIPQATLDDMTLEQVAQAVADYPFLTDAFLNNASLAAGVKYLQSECDAYAYLTAQDGGLDALAEKADELDAAGDVRGEYLRDILEAEDGAGDAAVVGDHIYMAYFSGEENGIAIEASHDGGSSFETHYVALETYDAGSVYLAFFDENEGLLLYCSSPAAGQMTKLLYRTEDGGKNFAQIADLTGTIENYPTELAVCGTTALILTQNHGSADYAFRSDDSGVTWEAYHLESVNEEAYRYIDGVSVAQNPDGSYTLTLCGVTDDGREMLSVVLKF